MRVNIKREDLEKAKMVLADTGRTALRLDVTGFGWAGPIFSVVLDEQRETDITCEVDGVKFVVEDTFADFIKDVEITVNRGGFAIKQSGSC